jgi:D-alanyl-lipoteichoic acid acyltransferase DltB (MBOAT superfamily)
MGVALVLWCMAYYFPKFKNFVTTDINLLITMILGGLWHGPSVNFLKWGALNGIGLVVYKYWRRISPYEHNNSLAVHFWKVFLTFNFITFTRIFFVVQDPLKSQQVIEQIFVNGNYSHPFETLGLYAPVFLLLLVAFVIHWLPVKIKETYTMTYENLHPVVQVATIAGMVFLMLQINNGDVRVPFTYTQF